MRTNPVVGVRPDVLSNLKEVEHRMLSAGYSFDRSKVLGIGSYANVYLTGVSRNKHKVFKHSKGMVAMKVINKKNVPFGYKEFIAREVANHKQVVTHPNIVHMYEMFGSAGFWYIPMEYCSHGNMLEMLQRHYKQHHRGLEDEDARHYFNQLLHALHHCHQKGIVHRDLKLENLLIDGNNNLKLSDFGFATSVPYSGSLLREWCGSIQYAAPEILLRQWYDGKLADMWSLGVVLYTLVNGRQPMQDCRQLAEILELARTQNYRMHRKVSKEAVLLILQILQIDPQRRPPTDTVMEHPWCHAQKLSSHTRLPQIGRNGAKTMADAPAPAGALPVSPRDPLHWRHQKCTINVGEQFSENIKLKSRDQATRRVLNKSCGMGMIWKPALRLAETYQPLPATDNLTTSYHRTIMETKWHTRPRAAQKRARVKIPVVGQRIAASTNDTYMRDYELYNDDIMHHLLGIHMDAGPPASPEPSITDTHNHPNWVTVKQLTKEFRDQARQEAARLRTQGQKVPKTVAFTLKRAASRRETRWGERRTVRDVPCRIPRLVPGYVFECGSDSGTSLKRHLSRGCKIPVRTVSDKSKSPPQRLRPAISTDRIPVLPRVDTDQHTTKAGEAVEQTTQRQCSLPAIRVADANTLGDPPSLSTSRSSLSSALFNNEDEMEPGYSEEAPQVSALSRLTQSPFVNAVSTASVHSNDSCDSQVQLEANEELTFLARETSRSRASSAASDSSSNNLMKHKGRSLSPCSDDSGRDYDHVRDIVDGAENPTSTPLSETGTDLEGSPNARVTWFSDERENGRSRMQQGSVNQVHPAHTFSSWHDFVWLNSRSCSTQTNSTVIGDQRDSTTVEQYREERAGRSRPPDGSGWSSAPGYLHTDLSESRQSSRPPARFGHGFGALGRFSIAQVHTPNFASSCSDHPTPAVPPLQSPDITGQDDSAEQDGCNEGAAVTKSIIGGTPPVGGEGRVPEATSFIRLPVCGRHLAEESRTGQLSCQPQDGTTDPCADGSQKLIQRKTSSGSFLPPISSADRGVYPVTTFDPSVTLRCLISTNPMSAPAKSYTCSRTHQVPLTDDQSSTISPARNPQNKEQRSSGTFEPEGLEHFPWLLQATKPPMRTFSNWKADVERVHTKTLHLPPLILPQNRKRASKVSLAITSCPVTLQRSADSPRATKNSLPCDVRASDRPQFQDKCQQPTRKTGRV